VPNRAATVLLADDHRLMREGTAALLATDPRIRIVGLASGGDEAIEIALQVRPSVALLDLHMPDRSGIEVAAVLRQRLPETRVLILTVSEQEEHLYEAIRIGADGYLLKDMPPAELIEAVLDVNRGQPIIASAMAARMLRDLPTAGSVRRPGRSGGRLDAELRESLTEREQEVLSLLARGLRNREIADTLVVSEPTIKTHVRHIMEKLHVRNRAEAAVYAARDQARRAATDARR
jgi:DNA-binding NarL/FixJ family response regulator